MLSELVVLHNNPGTLAWLPAVLVAGGLAAAAALAAGGVAGRVRAIVLAAALGLQLLAPASWAVQTLGHATSGTFPAGGPATAAMMGGPRGGGPGGGAPPAGAPGFGPAGPGAGMAQAPPAGALHGATSAAHGGNVFAGDTPSLVRAGRLGRQPL